MTRQSDKKLQIHLLHICGIVTLVACCMNPSVSVIRSSTNSKHVSEFGFGLLRNPSNVTKHHNLVFAMQY